ncbi:hypothetical protein BDZ97DRAFT_1918789 [Flammula alnicola]|nr:hypothetical protein BDZ97DRAFT_1918789 [Flammula alnicola]
MSLIFIFNQHHHPLSPLPPFRLPQERSKRYSTVHTNKADPSPAPPLVERCGPTFRWLKMGGDGAERTRGDPRRGRPCYLPPNHPNHRLYTETMTCLTSSSPPRTWSGLPDHVRVRLDTRDRPPPSMATSLATIDAALIGPDDEPAAATAGEVMTPRCRRCIDDDGGCDDDDATPAQWHVQLR